MASPGDVERTDLDAVLGEYHRALDAFFRGDATARQWARIA